MFRVGLLVSLIGLLALASHDARAHDRDRDSLNSRYGFGGVRERVDLARPDPAPDADAEGHLHLLESRGRSAIHVHVKNLDPGATYTVKISKGDTTETLGSLTVISENPPPPPPRCFKSSLTGAQEVPPVETDAKGWGIFLLNRERTKLYYHLATRGLSGKPTAALIQKGKPGENGDVLITLDAADLRGSVDVTAEQVAALASGETYVNLKTEAHADGEIRGQVIVCRDPRHDHAEARDLIGTGKLVLDTGRGDKLPLGADSLSDLNGSTIQVQNAGGTTVLSVTLADIPEPPPPPPPRCFSAELAAGQVVPPPAGVTATGHARLYLWGRDRSSLYYAVKVEGLSGAATAAHLHAGAAGANGDVLLELDFDDLNGTRTYMDGMIKVTPEQVAALESGNTYLDIHTEANKDGEIRGQVAICAPKTHDDAEPAGGDTGGDAGGQALVDPDDEFFDDTGFNVSGRHDATFIRGDANADHGIDIADGITVLNLLFLGGPFPYCQDAVDANDDGLIDIADAVSVVGSLFLGDGPLPAPGIGGGFDPTDDQLFCNDGP